MDFDPALTAGGALARQTYSITFGHRTYRAHQRAQVVGDITGVVAMDAAVESAYQEITQSVGDAPASLTLHNDRGEAIVVRDESGQGVGWLRRLVTAIELIEIERETRHLMGGYGSA